MEILDAILSKENREKYIETFINTKSPIYCENISKPQKRIDGYCYDAYLWDCLKEPCVKTEEQCEHILKVHETLFVFWDIHSCENIFTPNYWKFPKEAVIKLFYEEYMSRKKEFVEDVYFFDQTFRWSVILTHEYVENKRFCYYCTV